MRQDVYDGSKSSQRLRTRRAPRWLRVVIILVAGCTLLAALRALLSDGGSELSAVRFDAVVIPGGGLNEVHEPAAWVTARLDAALRHDSETDAYLVLSRGTTHKPPPLDADGFPVDESAASARYLVRHGVSPRRVLLESWSLDTIGNAAFARLMHADLRRWKRVLVVTSAFHMARTRAIFDWVFALPPALGRRGAWSRARAPQLEYEEVAEGSGARRTTKDEHQMLDHLGRVRRAGLWHEPSRLDKLPPVPVCHTPQQQQAWSTQAWSTHAHTHDEQMR